MADAKQQSDFWEEPDPLPSQLHAVAPFDLKLLPAPLQAWIGDISKGMNCPPDFAAVTAMVSLAAVIGRKVGIRPKARDNNFEVIPNLWGVLIARPSELKTPSMNEALKPLKRLETNARNEHNSALGKYVTDNELYQIQKKEAAKQAKISVSSGDDENARKVLEKVEGARPVEPTRTRYIVNDCTIEKLGELLNQNPNGLIQVRDELSGWLKSLDREEHSNDRAFYLEAFNGNGRYTYDRIGRGTIDIEALTVSIIGTIQPGKILPYVNNAVSQGASDDGLVQRLQLAVLPDSKAEWKYRDVQPDQKSKAQAYEVFAQLAHMAPPSPAGDDEICFVRFQDDAQIIFIEWWTELEHEIRSPDIHPAIEAHLAKYRSLAPSLALVIHLSETGCVSNVSGSAMIKAAGWCEYLKSHAFRIYGMAVDTEIKNAETILAKVRAGKLQKNGKLINPARVQDIRDKGWSGLTKTENVQKALELLIEYGWVLQELRTPPGSGRPSTVYHFHPTLLTPDMKNILVKTQTITPENPEY